MAASPGYTLLDDLLPEILQYCNHAPSIMVRIHLLNNTIMLCNKALVLKKSPSSITLEEDVHTYTLKYSGNRYRSIAIDSVKFEDNDKPLTRTTEREMDGEFANWRAVKGSKPTRYFLTDDTNKIRLWPTPSDDIDDNDLEIITRVTYLRGQEEIDEHIYEKWHEVIQAGTISSMLMIGGSTWFNPQLSIPFERKFSRGIREARKTTLTGTGKYPGRVIPQGFIVQGGTTDGRSETWV